MALRWKKNAPKRGLAAVVAGPRGHTLNDGGEYFASVNALLNRDRTGPRYKGWYWVARNDARGVPLKNTCYEPCADEAEAKAAAMAYVKKCLAEQKE